MESIGIAFILIVFYRLYILFRKNNNVSKNSLFLGTIVIILCVEAIDKLTTNLLYNYLGKIYYNRLIGILIDSILIGALFREPTEGLSDKETLLAKVKILCSITILSWYFMYYLCK